MIALRTSADGATPTYSYSRVTAAAGELYGNVRAHDMNGDGKMDLVLGQNTGRILLGDGAGGFTLAKTFGSAGFTLVADIDGDGSLDVAAANGSIQVYYFR